MATIPKILFRGAATTTTSTTIYTVPSSTRTVVTNIVVANKSGSDATFTLSLGGFELHSSTTVAANSSAYVDLKQVLDSSDTIQGGASVTDVTFHISGVEIS
jgi:hypothetical protein